MMQDLKYEAYQGDLNPDTATIAEVFGAEGYRTYMSGKWHVTRHAGPEGPKHNWPVNRGFDKFKGIIAGAANYWRPCMVVDGNDPVPEDEWPADYFITDAISDDMSEFIRQHADESPEKPFFGYLAYTAPHWPLHAHPEDIVTYKGRFNAGWDTLREERRARMVEMGLIDAEWNLSPRDPTVPPWEDEPEKKWQRRRMEVYAAQIERMDRGIGRVLDMLEKTGRLETTLIMFLADNGGCAEELQPGKFSLIGKAATENTRDGRPVQFGNTPEIVPGADDTYCSYGVPWANVSNSPFRLYKHWVHEGGIATPFIVHWPSGLTEESAGSINHGMGQLPDIMATCLDAAGVGYPEERDGIPIPQCEGYSILPLVSGRNNGRRFLMWEHEGNGAFRQDRWKLVKRYPDDWELYDMVADRTETNNLVAERENLALDLRREYEAWSYRVKVKPWDEILSMRRQ